MNLPNASSKIFHNIFCMLRSKFEEYYERAVDTFDEQIA